MSEFEDSAILRAIKHQRWYFFQNKPKIIFDRDTGLIWADLKYFHYGEGSGYSEDEAKSVLRDSQNWGGYNGWKIPTAAEFWQMIEDKTFPYHYQSNSNWRIKNRYRWFARDNRDRIGYINLDYSGENFYRIYGYTACYLILCSDALFSGSYDSNNPQSTLDLFVRNNLIPIFVDRNFDTDEKITQLYKQIYIDKVEVSKPKLTAKLDYKPLLKNYDLSAIAQSPIQYYMAVQNLTDSLLDILQEYEAAQDETIGEFSQMALKLNARYIENPQLTPEENSLLKERQKFLAARLELGLDDVKAQILSVKAQADYLEARIDKINHEPNSIIELAIVEETPRASFAFLVENLAHIISGAQRKVDFFVQHKNFVAAVINAHESWNDDYRSFKTNLREQLKNICAADGIDEEIYSEWYEDWRGKRFLIEQKFLPLIEFALKGNLISAGEENSAAIQALNALQTYKNNVANFYLNERKNIYQKFVFQVGGDLQEKFETESELYKLTEKLQRALQEIIFSREKTEERIFLLHWAESLIDVPIDEITNFIQERESAQFHGVPR